jgi:long-chain acyl-CoA synthetase
MVFEKKRWIVAAALACALPNRAAELEGVSLEDRIRVDGEELQLNGMALRTRLFFKVYVGGLYFGRKVSTPQDALDAKGAKRIIFVMMREASAEQFVESIDEGLHDNHTPEELARVKHQTEALFAMIRNVGQARKGARIVLDYVPSAGGTTLFVDGVAQGKPMADEDFYRALLRIWLGERPAQEGLKRALLGQPL